MRGCEGPAAAAAQWPRALVISIQPQHSSFPLSPSVTSSPRSSAQHFLRLLLFMASEVRSLVPCRAVVTKSTNINYRLIETMPRPGPGPDQCRTLARRCVTRYQRSEFLSEFLTSKILSFCCLLAGTCFKLKCWSPVSFLRLSPATQYVYNSCVDIELNIKFVDKNTGMRVRTDG